MIVIHKVDDCDTFKVDYMIYIKTQQGISEDTNRPILIC